MARGKRPATFRTRKLSLSAPMVLPWRRGGRVGRRRTTIPERGSELFALAPVRRVVRFSAVVRRRVRPRSKRYPQVMTAPRRGSGGSPSRRGGAPGGGQRGGSRGGTGRSASGGTGGTPRGNSGTGRSDAGGSYRGGGSGRSASSSSGGSYRGSGGTSGRGSASGRGDRPQRPSGGYRGRPENEAGDGPRRSGAGSGGQPTPRRDGERSGWQERRPAGAGRIRPRRVTPRARGRRRRCGGG